MWLLKKIFDRTFTINRQSKPFRETFSVRHKMNAYKNLPLKKWYKNFYHHSK